VLGSLFDYLKSTGLDKTTYVMIMSDNGSAMLRDERPAVTVSLPGVCQVRLSEL
jgi:arylsulfatase A-like enzyme